VVSFGKIIYMIFRDYVVVVIDLEEKIAKRKLVFEAEVNKIEEGIEISICDLLKL
jgi:phosphate transport system protein